jgi:hypothetical protein
MEGQRLAVVREVLPPNSPRGDFVVHVDGLQDYDVKMANCRPKTIRVEAPPQCGKQSDPKSSWFGPLQRAQAAHASQWAQAEVKKNRRIKVNGPCRNCGGGICDEYSECNNPDPSDAFVTADARGMWADCDANGEVLRPESSYTDDYEEAQSNIDEERHKWIKSTMELAWMDEDD